MFDIGMTEMLVVGVLALVVVGPKELPRLLRTIGGLVRRARELTADFREGVESLAAEAERDMDPFHDLRESEGIMPGMSPEEITDHILGNREREAQSESDPGNKTEGAIKPAASADKPKPVAKKIIKKPIKKAVKKSQKKTPAKAAAHSADKKQDPKS